MEIWELEIWKSENLEIQKFGIQTKHKTRITKSKSMSPHMCGVVGKSSWPHFVPFVTNFPMDRKMQKKSKKLRISFGGPMLLSTLGEVIGVYRISLMIKVAPSPNFLKWRQTKNSGGGGTGKSSGGGKSAWGGKGGGGGKGKGAWGGKDGGGGKGIKAKGKMARVLAEAKSSRRT